MQDFIKFIDEPTSPKPKVPKLSIILVDDDYDVHLSTALVFRNTLIAGMELEILSAYGAKEGLELFKAYPNTCLAIIDVVMEKPDAGLHLVDAIRALPNGKNIRLILRTGQPNLSTELEIAVDHLINGYITKGIITYEGLLAAITMSYRDYITIKNVESQLTSCRVKKLSGSCPILS